MTEIKQYATKSDCYKAGRSLTSKRGVLIHSTATPGATPERFAQVWNVPNKNACTHAVCDDTKVIQLLPYDMRCWGCGGSGNNHYVQIEMCEPADIYFTNGWNYNTKNPAKTKDYVIKCVDVTVEWAVTRLLEMGITEVNTTTVTSHYEGYKNGIASNHGDPKGFLSLGGLTMDDFRAKCKKLMAEKLANNKPVEQAPAQPVEKKYYRVRLSWTDAKSQLGAYENLDNAKKACKEGYTVYDWNGNAVYANKKTEAVTNETYKVGMYKVNCELNIRKGPSTDYDIVGVIKDKGTYTIVEVQNGHWGRLKSGAGWISIHKNYCTYRGDAAATATTNKKSNEEIAKEVIKGLWGNGQARKDKLKAAGYDYATVQKIVNSLLR